MFPRLSPRPFLEKCYTFLDNTTLRPRTAKLDLILARPNQEIWPWPWGRECTPDPGLQCGPRVGKERTAAKGERRHNVTFTSQMMESSYRDQIKESSHGHEMRNDHMTTSYDISYTRQGKRPPYPRPPMQKRKRQPMLSTFSRRFPTQIKQPSLRDFTTIYLHITHIFPRLSPWLLLDKSYAFLYALLRFSMQIKHRSYQILTFPLLVNVHQHYQTQVRGWPWT